MIIPGRLLVKYVYCQRRDKIIGWRKKGRDALLLVYAFFLVRYIDKFNNVFYYNQ